MSDELKNSDTDAIIERLKEKAELQKKRDAVLAKELTVKERRYDNDLAVLAESDRATEIANTVGYATMADSELEKILKDNEDYITAARNRMIFINEKFDSTVPFFRQNIILLGSQTGEGKSTTVANIIRSVIRQKHKETGKRRRCLVITNEERPADVYNRVTCLAKGWPYVSHDKFTQEQFVTLQEYIKVYTKEKLVHVIEDDYGGATGSTRTIEGICRIFDDLLARKEFFDVVLIDYYQNVAESRKNPFLDQYKVQAALAKKLDQYKNTYPAPIVLFTQLKPHEKEDSKTPFKWRIEGTKAIINVATCVLEIVPNRDTLTTEWNVVKNRFAGETVGTKIDTGYHKGRFISQKDTDWTEYQEKLTKMIRARDSEGMDLAIAGIEPSLEKKDGKVEPNSGNVEPSKEPGAK